MKSKVKIKIIDGYRWQWLPFLDCSVKGSAFVYFKLHWGQWAFVIMNLSFLE